MKPISIPTATIEAHGAQAISLHTPSNYRGSDGEKVEPIDGMKVQETVYTLIGIENQGELEALKRTGCFYLGFPTGAVPVFTLRVADVIAGQVDEVEELPTIQDNFELHQAAHDSWKELPVLCIRYFKPGHRFNFMKEVGTDNRGFPVHLTTICEADSVILHNPFSGDTCVMAEDMLHFLYGGKEDWEVRVESELQTPDVGFNPNEETVSEVSDIDESGGTEREGFV